MYRKLFEKIKTASKKKSLTFFVGAGISALSNAPTWKQLIEAICDEMQIEKKKDYTTDDYLRISQMFFYSIKKDKDKYYDFVSKQIGKKRLKSNIIHKMMLDLDPISFITTNYDGLIEQAAGRHCRYYKTVVADKEVPSINGDKYILKIHGDLNHKNIVLKEEDYLNYSENFKLIETLLKSIFSTNTVVFIGYGINDNNIKLIINWAKELLEDSFNKPIFIYTGDIKLSDKEKLYHESRGLDIIEYYNCDGYKQINGDKEYENRYKTVLSQIKLIKEDFLEGKNDNEIFDYLYEKLEPLLKVKTLRAQDLHKLLYPYVVIDNNGVIMQTPRKTNIFKRFLELNQQTVKEYLAPQEQTKYESILKILLKARIVCFRDGDKFTNIITDRIEPFSDENCLTFNYCKMQSILEKSYTLLQYKYLQAYYCAKLQKYAEAHKLFNSVAEEAFVKKEYVLYYFARVNANNLYKTLKWLKEGFYNDKEADGILMDPMLAIPTEQTEHVFDDLPYDFKHKYICFKDLNSVSNLLYENSYKAFQEGNKLQRNIDRNSIEFGYTSANKVIERINSSLHFFLGNGLFIDEYSEFKSTIQNQISLLLYKYSTLLGVDEEENILKLKKEKIEFDYVDFYCLVEYFDERELSDLFKKYNIEQIQFKSIEKIYESIKNLLKYFSDYLVKEENYHVRRVYENKLKTCLFLLRYIDIEQNVVDLVCEFICKFEFGEIDISDKVMFLDNQIYKRKKASEKTSRIIENKLIEYTNLHLNSIKNGKEFNMFSTRGDINYHNLIYYISLDKNYISSELSKKVKVILNSNSKSLIEKGLMNSYYKHLDSQAQGLVIKYVKDKIYKTFDFEYVGFLVVNGTVIEEELISLLIKYLDKIIENKEKVNSGKSLDEMVNIGYWCFMGLLSKEKFQKYLGYSNKFDFFYLGQQFDFDNFDVKWLYNLHSTTYENLSKNSELRKKISNKIVDKLKFGQLQIKRKEYLNKILIKYFV